jgi:hypothetical protein
MQISHRILGHKKENSQEVPSKSETLGVKYPEFHADVRLKKLF